MQPERRGPKTQFLGTHDLGFKQIKRIQPVGLRGGKLGRTESRRMQYPRRQMKKVTKEMKGDDKKYVFTSKNIIYSFPNNMIFNMSINIF